MLGFIIVVVLLDIASKIVVGTKEYIPTDKPRRNKYDNGVTEKYSLDNTWKSDNVDDAMEFHELRLTGWCGNTKD